LDVGNVFIRSPKHRLLLPSQCLNGKEQSENQHCNNTTSKREISLARRPNQYHITENRKEAETSKRQKYPL
ncbi:hypothetical protein XENORESO_000330, partial [Xenotaenia resolanae]